MSNNKPIFRLIQWTANSPTYLRVLLTLFGMTLFLGLIASFIYGGLWLDRILGRSWELVSIYSTFLSSPLIFLGLVLMLWSSGHFFYAKGSPVPFNPPPRLVNTGLYTISRNPMLTGVYLFLIGIGILLQSVSLLLIFVPIWIALMTWWVVAVEEPELEKRLGQDYFEYKKRVPMFGVRIRKRM